VFQRAFQHIAHDLHVTVAVGRKTFARRHPILVDDAQHRKLHVCRVMVIGERECVMAIQPSMVGVAAVFALRTWIMTAPVVSWEQTLALCFTQE